MKGEKTEGNEPVARNINHSHEVTDSSLGFIHYCLKVFVIVIVDVEGNGEQDISM